MKGATSTSGLQHLLRSSRVRQEFISHAFFSNVRSAPLEHSQVGTILGQWWHPLHYFPTFLARCVAILPDIASKCAIARILFQETGEGDPRRAHEVIFSDTMERVGFGRNVTTEAPAFEETMALVEGYRVATGGSHDALGVVYATEVADLVMVSAIGTAVRRVTGATDLEWVDIHELQEPDHVHEADSVMLPDFDPRQRDTVVESAERLWRSWTAFFDRLEAETFARPATVVAESR